MISDTLSETVDAISELKDVAFYRDISKHIDNVLVIMNGLRAYIDYGPYYDPGCWEHECDFRRRAELALKLLAEIGDVDLSGVVSAHESLLDFCRSKANQGDDGE